MRSAIYPGSFDPITFGHVDVLERAARVFDEVIVSVLENPDKRALFTLEQRVELIRASTSSFLNVQVDSFSGLLVDFLKLKGVTVVIRGLREQSDFENEMRMAQMNRALDDAATTMMIATKAEFSCVSSSLIKDIAKHGGDISKFVPPIVAQAMQRKYDSR